LRQRGHGGAGVGTQDADDFAVGVVELGHGGSYNCQIVNFQRILNNHDAIE